MPVCGRMTRPILRANRYLERLIWWEMSRLVSSALGASHARLCLGGGPTLPPASGLLLVAVVGVFSALWCICQLGNRGFVWRTFGDSPLAQPPTLFSLPSLSCRFRYQYECLHSGRRSPGEKGIALAEMPEAGKSMLLLRRLVGARASVSWSKDSAGNPLTFA